MLQVVLLCPQLVSYDERVRATEICHGPAIELSVWKKNCKGGSGNLLFNIYILLPHQPELNVALIM